MADGLKLFCKFAFPPNELHYCGSKELPCLINEFLSGNSSLENSVREKIPSFEMAFPYLSLLAEKNKCSFLDEKIVEGYWIGNDLIKGINKSELEKVYFSLVNSNYLNKEAAEEIISVLPEKTDLHHSFHVFLFHSLTDKTKATINFMDSCKISFGKILEKNEETKKLLVEYYPIVSVNDELFLGDLTEKEISFFPEWKQEIKQGNLIAFHWNVFCTTITGEQFNELKKFTENSIKCINLIK